MNCQHSERFLYFLGGQKNEQPSDGFGIPALRFIRTLERFVCFFEKVDFQHKNLIFIVFYEGPFFRANCLRHWTKLRASPSAPKREDKQSRAQGKALFTVKTEGFYMIS